MKNGAMLALYHHVRNNRFNVTNRKQKGLLSILLLFIILITGGYASIIGERAQLIGINSNPDSAKITIKDENNQVIFKGTTPTSVILRKGDGYFYGKDYTVELDKEGYNKQITAIRSAPNDWYIVGNIIFGGLIGWLIVDPATGAMWTLSPDKINTDFDTLKTKGTGSSRIYPDSFSMVWTAIPAALNSMELVIVDENEQGGYFVVKRGKTASEPGEKIIIFMEKLANGKSTKVEVVSKQGLETNPLAPNLEETIFDKLTVAVKTQKDFGNRP